MATANPATSLRSDLTSLSACAAIILVVHFVTGNGYGFHRDELQFLDDARHLAWGFVAYPPLTSFCARIAIALFGISPQVLRLPAAIVNTITLVLAGLIARELGGRRMAQIITLCAVLPVALVFSSLMQYTTFDLFSWTLLAFFTAHLLGTGDQRSWIGIGAAIGIGVLSKYAIAFPVAGLLGGLIVMPSQRHHLRSRWFWMGVLTAAIIAAPNLIWLAHHHFITIHMEQYIHARDVRHGRAKGFYSDQFRFTLFAFPLAIAGLVSLLRNARFRLLSALYIGPFLLFAIAKGRGYYLMPAYTVLFAAGSVALEGVLAARAEYVRIGVRAIVIFALITDAALFSYAYLPIWHVASSGWNWQIKNNGDIRDEYGWPEFVAQVAAVRDTLPAADRAHLAIMAHNYGEAGALALYGPQYNLPTAISETNSFHDRGYGPYEPDTVIVTGTNLEDQLRSFETCTVAARVQMPYNIQNEESADHPEILICRHLRFSWPEAWADSQEFG
jgi:4-amino-4-deoxy-L-arabinose transferase-like glycosyltransferase